VKTTIIYTHVLNRGGKAVRSPLDLPRFSIEQDSRASELNCDVIESDLLKTAALYDFS
jgi:hypothetical protein